MEIPILGTKKLRINNGKSLKRKAQFESRLPIMDEFGSKLKKYCQNSLLG
jgi:hypothetical protein